MYSFSHRNCFSLSLSEQGTHGAKQRSIHVPSVGAHAYHTLLQQRLVPGLLGLSPRCTLSCCDRDPYRRFRNTGNHRNRIHKNQGPVVRKSINANLGLVVDPSFMCSLRKFSKSNFTIKVKLNSSQKFRVSIFWKY